MKRHSRSQRVQKNKKMFAEFEQMVRDEGRRRVHWNGVISRYGTRQRNAIERCEVEQC